MKHKIIEFTEKELETEIWKPIPHYEGMYEASNLGRIRTDENKTTYTSHHGIRHWEQRILKYKVKNGNEYKTGYRVSLWKDGKSKDYLVARLIASTFIENNLLNKSLTVNHIDGNRLNNHIENLEWCSLAENIKKGFENGLYFQKGVVLIDKKDNTEKEFRSLSVASEYLGFCHGYLSYKIKKGKFENSRYKWYLKQ